MCISNEKYRELIKGMIDQVEDNSNLRTIFMSIHQVLIDESAQVQSEVNGWCQN